ncbi:hypothetical protein AAH979_08185 [Plantactinospora sp. ZYX-F-223]|uniref:hypothetical protein n=1 Tax=Plantactinospora sp. ZYX-F-223 TaxID=3144103 RepID=UPI0031FCFB19
MSGRVRLFGGSSVGGRRPGRHGFRIYVDLVLALTKAAGAAPPPGTVRAAAIAGTARDHLAAHLDQNVTLAALAGVTGTSRFGVTRACIAHFGLPPHALRLRLRLDYGCGLIGAACRWPRRAC